MTSPAAETSTSLSAALALTPDGDGFTGTVADGYDVFGIPHGGYLLGLGGAAVLQGTGKPDIFTITAHYLRKAAFGPIRFRVAKVGGSRRFTTVTATAEQDDAVIMSIMASVGDRSSMSGPEWSSAEPRMVPLDRLAPTRTETFSPPNIAAALGMRLDGQTVGFASGDVGHNGEMRAVADADVIDQLTALIACDVTPPSAWNALGAEGWVPTVELTAHVRARPTAGPFTIDVVTNHVSDGFLEEDALVRDGTGRLIVQSRQLARWTS